MADFNTMLNSTSGLTFADAQQQIALQALNLTIQGTQFDLQQQRNNAQQSNLSAQQSLLEKFLLSRDAIKNQQAQIDITKEIQDFRNAQYDREYFGLAQNKINFERSIRQDLETGDKVAAKRAGSVKAGAAASGVVASQGSAQDMINFTLAESQRDTTNQFKTSYSRLLQGQEEMLNVKATQILSNFNVDTQINFNIDELTRRLRFI